MPTSDTQLGHQLITPDGREIRVPASAFPKLRRLGLLERQRGLPKLVNRVLDLLEPEHEGLTLGLRRTLGRNLEGPTPELLNCDCRKCRELNRL